MRAVTQEDWLKFIKEFDVGIVRGRNVFAKMQDWYSDFFKEGAARASHGFMFKEPPTITEADCKCVTGKNKVHRYLSDHHQMWVFRAREISADSADDMRVHMKASEGNSAYAIGGIVQFAGAFCKRMVGKWRGKTSAVKLKDKFGVFCTEYTGLLIVAGGLPYIEGKMPFEIDPSLQLNWFLDKGAAAGWDLAAFFDQGVYYLAGEPDALPEQKNPA